MSVLPLGSRVRIVERPVTFSRTPATAMGRIGTVVAVRGVFSEPESASLGTPAPPLRTLYQVCLHISSGDELLLDIFEHWLEPATDGELDAPR